MTLIAYQGEPGAYSEQASYDFFGSGCTPHGKRTFDEVFDDVAKANADYGVVPIENTTAGSIHRNYDLLIRHDLHIVGEVMVRISHQLLALPGVQLSDIKRIYSHFQPLGQCEFNLRKLLPDAQRIEVYDTAGSAKMLAAEQRRDTAAIASRRAAQLYQLPILREAIEDDPVANVTRFVVLSRMPSIFEDAPFTDITHNYKTSIVFTVPNLPGSLFKAMACFALRNIDLCKIESRPLQGSAWEYLFYIDFIGRHTDQPCAYALAHLGEFAKMLRILGSYPCAKRE
jgi:prephenate dehydratase